IKGQAEVQRIPVILLVGAFEPFDNNEAARVKADGHLTKPFEIKVLISAVNSLISAAAEEKTEDKNARPAISPDSRTGDSSAESAEIEVGALEVQQQTVVSDLSSTAVAPVLVAGDALASGGQVAVDVGQDPKENVELAASQDLPHIVPREGQNLLH